MGATELVWVMTMSPPNASIVKTAGNSQYFLRTRKNAQNSARKERRNARTSNGLSPRPLACDFASKNATAVARRQRVEFATGAELRSNSNAPGRAR